MSGYHPLSVLFWPAPATLLVLIISTISSYGQQSKKYVSLTNDQSLEILNQVETDLKNIYYDPQMHGVNLQEQFAHTRKEIAGAKLQDEALLYVTAAVFSLNDSHTASFRPRGHMELTTDGWTRPLEIRIATLPPFSLTATRQRKD